MPRAWSKSTNPGFRSADSEGDDQVHGIEARGGDLVSDPLQGAVLVVGRRGQPAARPWRSLSANWPGQRRWRYPEHCT